MPSWKGPDCFVRPMNVSKRLIWNVFQLNNCNIVKVPFYREAALLKLRLGSRQTRCRAELHSCARLSSKKYCCFTLPCQTCELEEKNLFCQRRQMAGGGKEINKEKKEKWNGSATGSIPACILHRSGCSVGLHIFFSNETNFQLLSTRVCQFKAAAELKFPRCPDVWRVCSPQRWRQKIPCSCALSLPEQLKAWTKKKSLAKLLDVPSLNALTCLRIWDTSHFMWSAYTLDLFWGWLTTTI